MEYHPFSLNLEVPSGRPERMWVVTKDGWSGIGFRVPRVNLEEFAQRDEASHPGVYVLSGTDPEGGQDIIYIGEADPLSPRLFQHKAKDFWFTAYIFTTKDSYLTKVHAEYLEKRLLHLARSLKRCRLENQNGGKKRSLPARYKAAADDFQQEILLCCPVLGLRAFEKPQQIPPEQPFYFLKARYAQGKGYKSPGGFTVLQGAKGRKDLLPSAPDRLRSIRATLLEQGVFTKKENDVDLMQDYEFSSPSAAAEVLLGRPANGLTEWKDAAGITLGERRKAFDTVSKEESSSPKIVHGPTVTYGETESHDQSEDQGERGRQPERSRGSHPDQKTRYFLCFPKKLSLSGLEASGFYSAKEYKNGFTVLKGAKGRRECLPSIQSYCHKARNKLLQQGILHNTGSAMELTTDHEFTSPTLAASVLLASSANGLDEWKDAQGTTLRDDLRGRT